MQIIKLDSQDHLLFSTLSKRLSKLFAYKKAGRAPTSPILETVTGHELSLEGFSYAELSRLRVIFKALSEE